MTKPSREDLAALADLGEEALRNNVEVRIPNHSIGALLEALRIAADQMTERSGWRRDPEIGGWILLMCLVGVIVGVVT